MSSLARLQAQVAQFRSTARLPEAQLYGVDVSVSGWSPAEHLDHLLKVCNAILGRVREENPPAEPRAISLLGRVILACGWIPRGRAKAPARVFGARASVAELEAALAKLEANVNGIAPPMVALQRPIVPHPVFGGLTPSQALRFIVIHNAHHFRIVDEILRSSARRNAAVATSRPSL